MSPAQQARIDAARLERVMQWHLRSGSHNGKDESQMCAMEAVAFVAGEAWSDSPACASPVISAFMRNWNDSLPSDEDRDRLLKPLVPKLVGTRATKKIETRRAFMAMDWLIRVHTPAWLDRVESLKPHAVALRSLEEIADTAGLVAAGKLLQPARADASAARDAARAAAWDAARAAAWDAAWAAARAAAWDAAWAAARADASAARDAARAAAWDAAWAAARAAAWDAARDAAWAAARAAARAAAWDAARAAAWDAAWAAAVDAAVDAAWDALKPTTEWLQTSAVHLVERMCEAA